MLPRPPREMLIHALAGTPDVLDAMLKVLPLDSEQWDSRPQPERFTLREMAVHMADMETVWYQRVKRTSTESEPFLPNVDQDQLVIDNDYKHTNPLDGLARFRQSRAAFISLLESLPEAAWQRVAHREHVGHLSLQEQVVYTLMHDCYHTQQVAQWLQA